MLPITEHKCQNCGRCCGPLMVTHSEIKDIKEFYATLDSRTKNRIRNQKMGPITCQFRDVKNKSCVIYPVRPEVCRLFGLSKKLQCPFGNSADLPVHLISRTYQDEHVTLPRMV
jgi:hypothetical protein